MHTRYSQFKSSKRGLLDEGIKATESWSKRACEFPSSVTTDYCDSRRHLRRESSRWSACAHMRWFCSVFMLPPNTVHAQRPLPNVCYAMDKQHYHHWLTDSDWRLLVCACHLLRGVRAGRIASGEENASVCARNTSCFGKYGNVVLVNE